MKKGLQLRSFSISNTSYKCGRGSSLRDLQVLIQRKAAKCAKLTNKQCENWL
jgi:hypothetical protein